jgi:hypothetical protein
LQIWGSQAQVLILTWTSKKDPKMLGEKISLKKEKFLNQIAGFLVAETEASPCWNIQGWTTPARMGPHALPASRLTLKGQCCEMVDPLSLPPQPLAISLCELCKKLIGIRESETGVMTCNQSCLNLNFKNF